MQTRDFRELIERVKLRSPVEVVVAERVPELKKKGSRWWARCPFHEEKTPSFSVDPERGTWHCFGACGEGGDVIAFVERFDGLSFLDSLRLLAQACGEEMPEPGRRGPGGGADDQDERDRLHDVLSRAAKLYARKLRSVEGSAAREYLRGRGFTDETVEAFGLGWAPARGNPVLEAARTVGFAERVLHEAGLIGRAEDGRVYDFFRGRLMIPIADLLGRTVGFGGRVLPGDERDGGKYVNTPETRLFKKARLIYGLHAARDAVRRTKHLVLMEGYTDVMAAHQAELENTAAVLGTATTDEHAGLVRRTGARRVTVVFDGDEAGKKAARRALAGLLSTGVELDVVPLEKGEDPCDVLLAEGGSAAFRAHLDGAREWFAWLVDGLQGLDPRNLAAEVDEILDLLERLPRPVERDVRIGELAHALRLPEEGIHQQARQRRRPRRPAPPAERPRGDAARDPDSIALAALLGACLLDNSLIPTFTDHVARCPEGDLREVCRVVLELWENGDEEVPIDAAAVLTALGDSPARTLVVPLVEEARTAESPQILARDQLDWFERRNGEENVREHREELAKEQMSLDDESTRKRLRGLHEELRRLKVTGDSLHHPASNS